MTEYTLETLSNGNTMVYHEVELSGLLVAID